MKAGSPSIFRLQTGQLVLGSLNPSSSESNESNESNCWLYRLPGTGILPGRYGSESAGVLDMVPRQKIRKFAAEVARRFKPRKIVLFGSYAYGRPTEDSDVDLLVVMSGKGRPQDKAIRIRLAVEADFPMDLIVRTRAEMRQRLSWGDSFLQEAVQKGISLYEAAHTRMGCQSRG